MIGDSYEHDVRGSEAAGIAAMHLERRSDRAESATLKSLSELVSRLVV
jgi:FMN phosphatase YigB (HAD superfamily)